MFDVLWTILLGVVGGIISSVIVSRVFMIQGEYQQQVKFVEGIIRKLGMIAGYLSACRAVFEVSYDQDVHIEKEMNEKGYKCEMEYYAAHRDKDWISASEILKTFKSQMMKTIETAKEEILNSNLDDKDLSKLLKDINCKSQYKNAQKSEYKNVQGSDIYSSGCASKKDRFSLRRYDGPLIETISE